MCCNYCCNHLVTPKRDNSKKKAQSYGACYFNITLFGVSDILANKLFIFSLRKPFYKTDGQIPKQSNKNKRVF